MKEIAQPNWLCELSLNLSGLHIQGTNYPQLTVFQCLVNPNTYCEQSFFYKIHDCLKLKLLRKYLSKHHIVTMFPVFFPPYKYNVNVLPVMWFETFLKVMRSPPACNEHAAQIVHKTSSSSFQPPNDLIMFPFPKNTYDANCKRKCTACEPCTCGNQAMFSALFSPFSLCSYLLFSICLELSLKLQEQCNPHFRDLMNESGKKRFQG